MVSTCRSHPRIIIVIIELSVKSPCLWASFHPSFRWYPQCKDILLNLYMKCWNSAFNARGSRLIIVVVQLGAVEIYVAAVETLRRKERQDETQFITKIDGFLSFIPPWMLMYIFAPFFLISPCVWPNLEVRVLVLVFFLLYE